MFPDKWDGNSLFPEDSFSDLQITTRHKIKVPYKTFMLLLPPLADWCACYWSFAVPGIWMRDGSGEQDDKSLLFSLKSIRSQCGKECKRTAKQKRKNFHCNYKIRGAPILRWFPAPEVGGWLPGDGFLATHDDEEGRSSSKPQATCPQIECCLLRFLCTSIHPQKENKERTMMCNIFIASRVNGSFVPSPWQRGAADIFSHNRRDSIHSTHLLRVPWLSDAAIHCTVRSRVLL